MGDLELEYIITDAEGKEVVKSSGVPGVFKDELVTGNVHLWHGRKDPYLYTATVRLLDKDLVIDEVSTRFGCRTFKIDPEEGFSVYLQAYANRT